MKNTMKFEFPSYSGNEKLARTVCAAFVIDTDPTVEEVSEIKTAISEAVTNSIIHGYKSKDGMVRIEGKIDNNTVTYVIRDNGCGIENLELARQPLYSGSGDEERSGMGFSIMEAFMDELTVESAPNIGTTVTMSKRLNKDDL